MQLTHADINEAASIQVHQFGAKKAERKAGISRGNQEREKLSRFRRAPGLESGGVTASRQLAFTLYGIMGEVDIR
jgi:hypothetical protein